MYVQYKNYFLGKTTHERFSKRAALSQAKADMLGFSTEDSTPLRKVVSENQADTSVEQLLP